MTSRELFDNLFVQAIGVGGIAYILFRVIGFSLNGILNLLSSFASWYRWYGLRYADEAAIGIGLVYLFVAAIFSSRQRR